MSIDMLSELAFATWQTLEMVFVSTFFAIAAGVPLGELLVITRDPYFSQQVVVHRSLSIFVNIVRSVPFIILLVVIMPLTRLLVGTSIGTAAAMVPLAISAIPFFARIVESAIKEVPDGLKEAAVSMGASPFQIIARVLLPEALGSLVRGTTLTVITLIGYSAMAGVQGGGGLGDLAIRYGYQRFDVGVLIGTVIVLIVMVQLVQWCGDRFETSLLKR
ncbi:MAG: methionine ABC transporter permease [Coxiella sp. (in: Bacteria)]|nr:MAG: methionine ABC transporter permease [Coxiella sp. (in: g-proteobacteria)]